MRPQIDASRLKNIKYSEYLVRVLFGGLISLGTGIVAHALGPVVAGLFLGFPAILPATLTLVERHKDDRAASRDALGAAAGSVGLVVFGLVVWRASAHWPDAFSLGTAALLWLLVGVLLWIVIWGGSSAPE